MSSLLLGADIVSAVSGTGVEGAVRLGGDLVNRDGVVRVYKIPPEELAVYDLDSCVCARVALRDV